MVDAQQFYGKLGNLTKLYPGRSEKLEQILKELRFCWFTEHEHSGKSAKNDQAIHYA
jgi:hypothetical protein